MAFENNEDQIIFFWTFAVRKFLNRIEDPVDKVQKENMIYSLELGGKQESI